MSTEKRFDVSFYFENILLTAYILLKTVNGAETYFVELSDRSIEKHMLKRFSFPKANNKFIAEKTSELQKDIIQAIKNEIWKIDFPQRTKE